MTKLTIIGAGSAVFTKNIFTDLMFIDDFKKMDIATSEQKKSTGKHLISVKNLLEKNFKENNNIEKYKDVLMKISGIMTGGRPPADIFLANKVYDCKSYSEPFFTNHVTNLKKIQKILLGDL